jgi:hypothetical protein
MEACYATPRSVACRQGAPVIRPFTTGDLPFVQALLRRCEVGTRAEDGGRLRMIIEAAEDRVTLSRG